LENLIFELKNFIKLCSDSSFPTKFQTTDKSCFVLEMKKSGNGFACFLQKYIK